MAADQHGVFTLAQARATGMRRYDIDYRVKTGGLSRPLPGVFCSRGAPPSWHQDVMATVCWAGDGSCASFSTAARLHALDGYATAGIEVSTGRNLKSGRRLPNGSRITVHRVDERLLPEIITAGCIPVTSPRRTLIDLAGRRDPRVAQALDRAVHKRITSIADVWLLLEREWMRGRRGVRIMRDILAVRTPGGAPSDSELERRMLTLLRRMGFPRPQQQYPLRVHNGEIHVDFAFPAIRLAIETDGYAWHMDGTSFERDRRRDNDLGAIGWEVRRFTWAMLRYDIAYVETVLAPFRDRLLQLEQ
jgi:very-short-patch-repair endonuclease